MTSGEAAYLILIVVAFGGFGVAMALSSLAWSRHERDRHRSG